MFVLFTQQPGEYSAARAGCKKGFGAIVYFPGRRVCLPRPWFSFSAAAHREG